MAVTARSPPQLGTLVTPSLTRSEMVTMEKGILLSRVSQEHSKGWMMLVGPTPFPEVQEIPGRSRRTHEAPACKHQMLPKCLVSAQGRISPCSCWGDPLG